MTHCMFLCDVAKNYPHTHTRVCAATRGCVKQTWSCDRQTTEEEGRLRKAAELQATSRTKIIMRTSQHPRGCKWLCPPPEESKHFLRGSCKTRHHLTDTSWQQHVDHYWFPLLLHLEKNSLQETFQQSWVGSPCFVLKHKGGIEGKLQHSVYLVLEV